MKNTANIKEFIIRPMQNSDLVICQELSSQLGYAEFNSGFKNRFNIITKLNNHHLVVAEIKAEKRVIAWLHLEIRFILEDEFKVQISGVVVDEKFRGHGVGKKLIEYAEKWALQNGFNELFLYSNVIRIETHKFYQKQGFENYKNSKAFKKNLKSSH